MTPVSVITASTIYSFPRAVRHGRYGPETDEACQVRSRDTVRLLRRMYRALRQAGMLDYEARIDMWLVLCDPVERVTIERITL